jgi:hypothetical protein
MLQTRVLTCVATDVITGILLKQQMNKSAGIWIPGSSLLNWNTAWKGIYFTILYNVQFVHADVSGYTLYISVPDKDPEPDPKDPYVFGSPGSGFGYVINSKK